MANPSEHQDKEVSTPSQVYHTGALTADPEQSSIYSDVHFAALGTNYQGIAVSPQCELGKPTRMPFIVFCPIYPIERFVYSQLLFYGFTEAEINAEGTLTKEKKDKLREFKSALVTKYMTNNVYRYYFLLGQGGSVESGLVDFQVTACLPLPEVAKLLKVAVLRSPFREDVVTRFGGFISRIGTAPVSQSIRESIAKSVDIPIMLAV